MISENDVLLILHNDDWFTPSKSEKKKTVTDKDGNVLEVAESYYHNLDGGGQIIIRVSNHGTSLRTWVKRRKNPSESLQNLSVVFSNEPVTSEVITEPFEQENESGEVVLRNLYFVVEQYVYRMDKLSISDFTKFINRVKSLDENKVFTDPFKKKPQKRALRKVLTPQTEDGEDVPPSNNAVHPRQTIVAQNREQEVDAEGNLIKETRMLIEQIVRQIIYEHLMRFN